MADDSSAGKRSMPDDVSIEQSSEHTFSRPLPRTRYTNEMQSTSDNDAKLLTEMQILRDNLKAAETTRDAYLYDLQRSNATVETLRANHIKLEEELVVRTRIEAEHLVELEKALSQVKRHEKRADQDRHQLLKERETLVVKHEAMSGKIQRLQERSASNSPVSSREVDRTVQQDSPFTHSRTNSSSTLLNLQINVTAKDRLIQDLTSQVQKLEAELQNILSAGDPRIKEMTARIQSLTKENKELKEDIDGYQTLLQTQTINGEFSHSQFMQSSSHHTKYQSFRNRPKNIDLASELGSMARDIEVAGREELEAEILELQETNKALSLYINTIVSRMLNTEGFEQLLAKDAANVKQPPAVPKKSGDSSSQSFLGRTKSVFTGKSPGPLSHEPVTEDSLTSRDKSIPPESGQAMTGQSLSTTQLGAELSSPSAQRRALSPLSKSPTRPVPITSKGLRPLQSGAVADHISTRDARRLSAQFAPSAFPPQADAKSANNEKTDFVKSKRHTWMGWLGGSKTSTGAGTGAVLEKGNLESDLQVTTGEAKINNLQELRPLDEIDTEIENSVQKGEEELSAFDKYSLS